MGDRIIAPLALNPALAINAVTRQTALDGQAKVTGGAFNYASQADVQKKTAAEDTWRQGQARQKRANDSVLAGLRRVQNMQKQNDQGGDLPRRNPWQPPANLESGLLRRKRKRR